MSHEAKRPLVVQHRLPVVFVQCLGKIEGSPNAHVDAFAEWLTVESLRLFERTQRLDHGNNYVSNCTTGVSGLSSPLA
jgi:hypothetical protein